MSNYTDWENGIANRNCHILETLAKDERVGKIIAVDFLPIGFNWKRKLKYFYINLIKGVAACDRDKKICVGSGETRFGDITSRCYQIKSKIYVYSSINSLKTVARELVEIKKRLDLENLIIWSYNPFISNLKEIKQKLNAKTAVFDAVDDWSKHSVYEKERGLIAQNYQKIKNEADVIFTVSKELKDGLFGDISKARWMPNGVDIEHFKKQTERIPDSMKDLKHPIIGYAGVIQDRFDIDLIKYLAQKNPDKNFVFVGWMWRGLKKIIERKFMNFKNIYFLGRKTYDELPDYIYYFDAAIIPHKVNALTKTMNPLKIYEYLACGKPIVSANVSGVEEFKDFIKIAKNREEFHQYINDVLKCDSDELMLARLEEARKHTWEKRVETMLETLREKI